jgi:hypothetical protein
MSTYLPGHTFLANYSYVSARALIVVISEFGKAKQFFILGIHSFFALPTQRNKYKYKGAVAFVFMKGFKPFWYKKSVSEIRATVYSLVHFNFAVIHQSKFTKNPLLIDA